MKNNDGYVYGQSVLGADKEFKEWVLNQSDYKRDTEVDALCEYTCSYLEQNYYLFDYRDEVIDAISQIYGWDLSQKYMSKSSIKNILKHRKNRYLATFHFTTKTSASR